MIHKYGKIEIQTSAQVLEELRKIIKLREKWAKQIIFSFATMNTKNVYKILGKVAIFLLLSLNTPLGGG